MATATKTPAVKKTAAPVKKTPVVAKKAPTKKAAAPVKPRSDYKPGARVKVKRKTGEIAKGFVTGVNQTPTGKFIAVNIGDKKNPNIVQARPAAVTGF